MYRRQHRQHSQKDTAQTERQPAAEDRISMASYVALATLVTQPTWLVGERTVTFSPHRLVMGILNVTPDSFSDGGDYLDPDAAVGRGLEMAREGADIVDVGGESTRPGADPVTAEEELRRVVPVIERLARESDVLISVDTSKAVVARAALQAGASIVNDISGLGFDPDMSRVVAEEKASLILMHIKGTPKTMDKMASCSKDDDDVVDDVKNYFRQRLAQAEKDGIDLRRVAVDPGIGFGKTTAQNFRLVRELSRLSPLGRPVMLGTSRKRLIGEALGGRPTGDRVWGTAATIACGLFSGAHIVRVHDVKEMVDVVRVTEALVAAPAGKEEGRESCVP